MMWIASGGNGQWGLLPNMDKDRIPSTGEKIKTFWVFLSTYQPQLVLEQQGSQGRSEPAETARWGASGKCGVRETRLPIKLKTLGFWSEIQEQHSGLWKMTQACDLSSWQVLDNKDWEERPQETWSTKRGLGGITQKASCLNWDKVRRRLATNVTCCWTIIHGMRD